MHFNLVLVPSENVINVRVEADKSLALLGLCNVGVIWDNLQVCDGPWKTEEWYTSGGKYIALSTNVHDNVQMVIEL